MSIRDTIAHLSTTKAICAYLAVAGKVLTGTRIITYMQLMHATSPATCRRALYYLYRRGDIERVSRGRYLRRNRGSAGPIALEQDRPD